MLHFSIYCQNWTEGSTKSWQRITWMPNILCCLLDCWSMDTGWSFNKTHVANPGKRVHSLGTRASNPGDRNVETISTNFLSWSLKGEVSGVTPFHPFASGTMYFTVGDLASYKVLWFQKNSWVVTHDYDQWVHDHRPFPTPFFTVQRYFWLIRCLTTSCDNGSNAP